MTSELSRQQSGNSVELAERLQRLRSVIENCEPRVVSGELLAVSGTIIRARLPQARIGELCELRDPGTGENSIADVIGIDGDVAFLAPYGSSTGLSRRTEIVGLQEQATVMVSDEMMGHVIDGMGKFISARGKAASGVRRRLYAPPPKPMDRRPIDQQLVLGIRAIDGMISCGKGQRIGIFGNASVGKSSLIAQIVRGSTAAVNVVALIGERGREVQDFASRVLTPDMRSRTIIVAATSDRPPVERIKAAYMATTIAEHYRDQGKDVLLVMDSVTRFARAQREIGLASGELPARRGFPPSVFSVLPQLFERAGTSRSGSITGLYSVLVEGDFNSDPIAEETKSLLDGHIILDQKLASAGHFPAINVLESRSRLMEAVTSPAHQAKASRLRLLMALYQDIELLIRVGEYKRNSDVESDAAIDAKPLIDTFLRQGLNEASTMEQTLRVMNNAA
ncbi:MAG: FliI/YscN family ATPase [Phyllobacteriaceae bacterium]|nr:FliI/YscN family ATPase [Phyllobacteriaceae bacterium]